MMKRSISPQVIPILPREISGSSRKIRHSSKNCWRCPYFCFIASHSILIQNAGAMEMIFMSAKTSSTNRLFAPIKCYF